MLDVHESSRIPFIAAMCREALAIQDAPNLIGLTGSLHDHLVKLGKDTGWDHDKLFRLPCVRLWIHQMCHITTAGAGLGVEDWRECCQWCELVIAASSLLSPAQAENGPLQLVGPMIALQVIK